MREITKLKDKYLVLKRKDLEDFFEQFTKGIFTTEEESKRINRVPFTRVLKAVQNNNKYVVLNLDDKIDIRYLRDKLMDVDVGSTVYGSKYYGAGKVSDVAVHLVNAILIKKDSTHKRIQR